MEDKMETTIMGLCNRVKGGNFGFEGLQSKKLCSKEAPKYPSLMIHRPFPPKRCSPDHTVLVHHQEQGELRLFSVVAQLPPANHAA